MVKLRARCILIGDAAVGKSALSQMFLSDGAHFQKNYSMTAGVDLVVKSVNIPDTSDTVELFIFDFAGKEMEMCKKLWGQPSALCLVFDLTNKSSFDSCDHWLESVRAHCQGLQVPGVLVGNKCDLSLRRKVETALAQEWAKRHGLMYHETSAKERENWDTPFHNLARALYEIYQDQLQVIQGLA